MDHLQNELKKEFQLERLILFSDAVFAIAITLLVIEIKVPELHEEFTDAALAQALVHLIPKFVGFFLSFIIIGLYWTIHHRQFGFVVNYDRRLLWLNLFFLMAIVLMPFSSGLYGEYSTPHSVHMVIPYGVYCANISFAGIMQFFLWRHITDPVRKLTEGLSDHHAVWLAKARSLVVPGVFALSFFAVLLHPIWGRYVPVLIPFTMRILGRVVRRKTAAPTPPRGG